jgi:hypothetical protein
MVAMQFHYVYYSYESWGRGYIGKRSCQCPPEEDTKYMGSFTDATFHPDQKIILETFASSAEALAAEIVLHDFYNVALNPHFANRSKQTSQFFDVQGVPKTLEHRRKIQAALAGRVFSSETKTLMSAAKKGNKHCVGRRNGLGNKSRQGQKDSDAQRLNKSLGRKRKYWIEVISPEGIHMCPLNLRLFCEEQGLHASSIRSVAQGQQALHKGWKAVITS